MDDEAIRARLEVLEEIVRELIRSSIVHPDLIERVAERFDIEEKYHSGSSRAEHYAHMAHMTRMMIIEAGAQEADDFRQEQLQRRLNVPPRKPKRDTR